MVAAPAYHDLATRQLHVDVLVKQRHSLTGHHSCARARAACLSLTDTALVHAQVDVLSVDDCHEADVNELREAFMVFYRRPKIAYWCVCDCLDLQHAVRIAQGHNADVDILSQHDKLDLLGIKFRVAHADSHQAIRIDTSFDVSRRAFEHEFLCRSVVRCQKTGHTAYAIATLFYFRAIGVKNSITGDARCVRRRSDPQQLVESRPAGLVTQFAELVRRWRRPVRSTLIDDQDLVSRALHFKIGDSHVFQLRLPIPVQWTFQLGLCSLHKPLTKLTKLPLGRVMRHIMVMNAKGGCGKSTLATNIASYFANQGAGVVLADYDRQRSSLDWLERRPDKQPKIFGVASFDDGLRRAPRNADFVIIDAPARSHGKELSDLVRHAETIVVPVLPSTIDIQATETFLEELKAVGKVMRKEVKIGTVANRVRDNTLIFDDLDEYLLKTRTPYIAALRDAQNYVRAYTRGLGIFELPAYLAWPDWEEWEPLTAWLRTKRSQP